MPVAQRRPRWGRRSPGSLARELAAIENLLPAEFRRPSPLKDLDLGAGDAAPREPERHLRREAPLEADLVATFLQPTPD